MYFGLSLVARCVLLTVTHDCVLGMLTYSASELYSLRRKDSAICRAAREAILNSNLWCPGRLRQRRQDLLQMSMQCIWSPSIMSLFSATDAVVLDESTTSGPLTEQKVPLQISGSLSPSQETFGVAIGSVPEDKVHDSVFSPSLYVLNAASLAKPHAIDQLSAELIGHSIDVAVVSETHLKEKHADSVVQIPEYPIFQRDRPGRKGGGATIYTRCSIDASEWCPVPALDPMFEMLWIHIVHSSDTAFIGALYHAPTPIYQASDLLGHIETAVDQYSLSIHRHESSWPAIYIYICCEKRMHLCVLESWNRWRHYQRRSVRSSRNTTHQNSATLICCLTPKASGPRCVS